METKTREEKRLFKKREQAHASLRPDEIWYQKDEELLTALATDEDASYRIGVALNESTPPETLDLMAQRDDWDVRSFVAQNPSTFDDTLLTLAVDDEEEEVRDHALKNLHKRIDEGLASEDVRTAVRLIDEAAADDRVFDCRVALDMAVVRAGDGSDAIWTLCLLTAFTTSRERAERMRREQGARR